MRTSPTKIVSVLLSLLPLASHAQTTPGGVLSQFNVTSFTGTGAVTINAMTTDSAGYVYVAGTTYAPDMQVINAAQPQIGEGLILRSLDRGATWQKLANPPGAPSTVTPHPTDTQTLFAGAADGIYKTTDGGQTWRQVFASTPDPESTRYSLAVDPANPQWVYVLLSRGSQSTAQFLSSADGGESWAVGAAPCCPTPSGPVWVDPLGSGIVGLAGWLSRDHGATWNAVTGLGGSQIDFTLPDPRNSRWIYAKIGAPAADQLFLSQDWGLTWAQLSTPAAGLQALLPDPDVAGTLYAVDHVDSFDFSLDEGSSWQQKKLSNLYFFPPLAALNRSCHGGALLSGNQVSLDFGNTWRAVPIAQISAVASGPGCALYAVRSATSDAFVAKLSPGGNTVLWSTFLGGSLTDSAVAISVDIAGKVYVAGNTSSPDFPTTAERIGVQGISNAFLTQFDSNGNLRYSVVIGGEATDSVNGMALSNDGNVFLSGVTDSVSFPVTPGALTFQPDPNTPGWTGFAARLSVPAGVIYSGGGTIAGPVAAEAGGTALFLGPSGVIYRMAADGSSLSEVAHPQFGAVLMATDAAGDLYVASVAGQSSGVQSTVCFYQGLTGGVSPGDLVVAKLKAGSLSPIYSSRVAGQCQASPQSISVGADGSVTLGVHTYGRFPTWNPALATGPYSPLYSVAAGVIVQLGPDGTLSYSTYVDSQAAPIVAAAPDDSLYAGVPGAGVLHLPVAASTSPLVIIGAFNAFSGAPGTPTPGMLLTITGQNLASDWIDLGLNDPNPLPNQLGNVQVLFDGTPAEIMQIAPDHVICVLPWQLAQSDRVTVQLVNGSMKSTPLVLPGTFRLPGFGLLSQDFPGLPGAGSVDGNIRNADGSLNGPDNPAAPLSTVTLFATGVVVPGTASLAWNAPAPDPMFPSPVLPVYLPATARAMGPGFIDAIWAIDVQIPASTNAGFLIRNFFGNIGSGLGVYVK